MSEITPPHGGPPPLDIGPHYLPPPLPDDGEFRFIGHVPPIPDSDILGHHHIPDREAILPSGMPKQTHWYREAVVNREPPRVSIDPILPEAFIDLCAKNEYRVSQGEELHSHPAANDLYRCLAATGHSRSLSPNDTLQICSATFDSQSNVPKEQWLNLRGSTFPYATLTSSEQQTVKDNLLRILEYMWAAGVTVAIIYLLLKRKKKYDGKEPSIIIINSGGGDVAIGGTIDKRTGGTYINLLDSSEVGVITQDDVAAYDVSMECPTEGHFKPLVVVLKPDNLDLDAFPCAHEYFNQNALSLLLSSLSWTILDEGIVNIVHLLSVLGSAPYAAKGHLARLLKSPNETTRAVVADVLASIATDSDVEKLLLRQLEAESSELVREIIVVSLVRGGSRRAIEQVFRYLIRHTFGIETLKFVAAKADHELINLALVESIKSTNEQLYDLVNFLALVEHSMVLGVALDILEKRDDYLVTRVISRLLGVIYSEEKSDDIRSAILSGLLRDTQSQDEKLALRAFDVLCAVITVESLAPLSEVAASPHKSVRVALIKYVETLPSEQARDMVKAIYQLEARPWIRQSIARELNEHFPSAYPSGGPRTTKQIILSKLGLFVQSAFLLIRNTVIPLLSLVVIGIIWWDGLHAMARTFNLLLWCWGIVMPILLAFLLLLFLRVEPNAKLFSPLSLGSLAILAVGFLLFILVDNWINPMPLMRYQTSTIVKDNFEQVMSNRWSTYDDNQFIELVRQDGQFVITIKEPKVTYWSKLQEYNFVDLDVSVDSYPSATGHQKSLYGIVYRLAGDQDLSFFGVSNDDSFFLYRKMAGKWTTLIQPSHSELISPDQNTLRLRVEGNVIQAYINGEKVVDFLDNGPIISGTVALAVGTYDQPGAKIGFDNFNLNILKW